MMIPFGKNDKRQTIEGMFHDDKRVSLTKADNEKQIINVKAKLTGGLKMVLQDHKERLKLKLEKK